MRTALFERHVGLGGRMVPFAGWEMPVQYAGILAEANAVRSKGGIFDVSHMGRIYVSGADATGLMEWVQTGRIGNLRMGRARYSLVCVEEGGILDDTVSYRLEENRYLLICNASNRDAVVEWLERWQRERYSQTALEDVTTDTAMIAGSGAGRGVAGGRNERGQAVRAAVLRQHGRQRVGAQRFRGSDRVHGGGRI